jgi:signal transduction histidine kinase
MASDAPREVVVDNDHRATRVLRAAGILPVVFGLGYLVWRIVTPSECAWLTPSPQDWSEAGVRPLTEAACALQPGTTVIGARAAGDSVSLDTGSGQIVALALDPSGPFVAQRVAESAWTLAFVVAFFALALYASWRRPTERAAGIAVVMSGALLGSTVMTVVGLPTHEAFAGPARWAFAAGTLPMYLLAWGAGVAWAADFPTPLVPRKGRMVVNAAGVAPVVGWTTAALLLGATSSTSAGWMHSAIVIQMSLTVTALVASIAILGMRLNRSSQVVPGSVPRQQLLWVAGSFCVAAILTLALWMVPQLIAGESLLPPELIGAPGLFFVAGFGIAMARYRLFDLDVVLARTLVYSGLTLAAIVMYLSTSAILAAGFNALAPGQVAVIGALLVAIIVNPVRVRLEGSVNRIFYGDRDQPYAALSRVAESITDRGAPDDKVADDIRRALRAPYVVITDRQGHTVASGDPTAEANGHVEFAAHHAGEDEGTLHVAVRGSGERFSRTERRLLADIARQIGAGLHERSLVMQLQQSRERIVVAREEERRALRRTLHDEVGPTMAALSLRAETVRRNITRSGAGAPDIDPVLSSMSADASQAAEVLRKLAYNLRPPALDEYGLEAALRRYTQSVKDPAVSFVADGALATVPLSAAVEAALYRIAVAAVSNASRHAHATSCTVHLSVTSDCARLTVTDNGRGLAPDGVKGVGILSMQERAAELGGSCTVSNARPGTTVCAQIPVGGDR